MEILNRSFSAVVLIVAIVIIRSLALHRFPKRTFLALWGVALCRLLIPFSIPSRFSICTLVSMLETEFLAADTTIIGMIPLNIGTAPGTTKTSLTVAASVSISPFMTIWIIGLSACAFFFLVTHLRCRREYKTALPVDKEFVRAWQKDHPTRRNVKIRQSDRIAAPLTYGILYPVVLLPKKTEWTDEARLQYILTHEFTHIKRFDTLTKYLLVIAVSVHWFNPFVWVMYVLANRDIELSCDEMVVRTFGGMIKSAYALTLIEMEEKKGHLTPLVNNFSKNAIEERIVSIMKIQKTSLVGILLSLTLVIGTTTVFATNAAFTKANNEESAIVATNVKKENNLRDRVVSLQGIEKESTDEDWKKAFEEFEQKLKNDPIQLWEEAAKTFAAYKKYGLTFNKESNQLYYNGEAVTHFEDNTNNDGKFNGEIYNFRNGKLVVRPVRNAAGEATGIESFSFDQEKGQFYHNGKAVTYIK